MATHLVLRALPGPGGRTYKPKERLDVSGIEPTRLRALEGQRYIRPLTEADFETALEDPGSEGEAAPQKRRGRKGR